MESRRGPSPLFLSLLASVLVHLIAAGLMARRPHDGQRAVALRIDDPEPQPRDEAEPDPVRLGIDRGQATSITWIGFDEYREHIARQSKVDQPELTMDAPSGDPGEAVASSESAAEAPDQPAESPPPTAREIERVAERAPSLPSPVTPADPGMKPDLPVGPPAPVIGERIGPAPAETPTVVEEVVSPAPDPEEVTPEQSDRKPAAMPRPTPAKGGGESGAQSDRESPASSILTAEWTKLGQPIAAKGLEIKTRKPRFTQYTRLMGAQRDPLVRVHFRRDGRVELVEMVRSSGNPDVDRPVTDAIYQWRATGESLERIAEPSPPATLPVEFRILL